jgi:hypothetical protein
MKIGADIHDIIIRQGIKKSTHNWFMYVYSGVNETTCFGLPGDHLQVLQVLAIGDQYNLGTVWLDVEISSSMLAQCYYGIYIQCI